MKVDEEYKMEQDAIASFKERQAKLKRVGAFKFDIDNELDAEFLTSDQVFEDIKDIDEIIGTGKD